MIKWPLALFVLSLAFSCAPSYKIIDKPIVFNEERKLLTLKYLHERYGLEQKEPTIVPKMIVLHWTAMPTFESSFGFFKEAILASSRGDINSAGQLNVSSQFMVDRDGTIYRLLPETTMARHVIGLNHCAIGIENVGGTEGLPLTNEQLKANIFLVGYLAEKYKIDYLIGHYEYTLFEESQLWLEKDDAYRTQKTDPGEDFMAKVRKATKKYQFMPLPKTQ